MVDSFSARLVLGKVEQTLKINFKLNRQATIKSFLNEVEAVK